MAAYPASPDTPQNRKNHAAPKVRVDLRTVLGLGVLAGAALLLRTWGLQWGVPDPSRYYPYHPDETVLLDAVCRVNPLMGVITPHFYSYGTLYIFLCRLAYDFATPFTHWGPVPYFNQPFSAWVTDFGHLLVTGRWVAVVLGMGTVLITWDTARRAYGARAGWLAGLFLAVTPMHVLLGHYMAVDVPAAFFSTLALLCALRALQADRPKAVVGWVLAAGAAAGLAAGTKYNGIIALVAILVPLWKLARPASDEGSGSRRGVGLAVAAGLGAAVAAGAVFLCTTPGFLLESALFWTHVNAELENNRKGMGLLFIATPPSGLYHLLVSLPIAMEWPLYLLSLAGIAYALRQRRPEDALFLLFLLVTYLTLATPVRKYLRYVMPLLPVLAILAARAADAGLRGRFRLGWSMAAGVAGLAALLSTAAHLGVLAQPDSRTRAATYLGAHAGRGDLVALASNAWFYTPPLHPSAGCITYAKPYGGPPVWDGYRLNSRLDLGPLGAGSILAPRSDPAPSGALKADELRQFQPKYVIVSDYEFEDPLRIRKADPAFQSDLLDVLAVLDQEYRPVVFRPRPAILGFMWWRWGTPPHDWRYYMPEVRIYEKR